MALVRLTGCVDDLVVTGVLTTHTRNGVDEAIWSAVHGLATLLLDGALASAEPDRQRVIVGRLLDIVQAGIG